MKKIILFVISSFLALMGCTTGPSLFTEFPVSHLQNINTQGDIPVACDFLGGNGDGMVAVGKHLYFIDSKAGYIKEVKLMDQPIVHVSSSSSGGYGLALGGSVLYVISNDTYITQHEITLPEVGRFVISRPSSNDVFVVCAGGTMVKITTLDWAVTKVGQIDATEPIAAVLGTGGTHFFIADINDNVYKISTNDFSTVAHTTVEGGVNGMCSTVLNEVLISPNGRSEVWAIDCGTGQHSRTFNVPYPATALAATSNGKFFYAAMPGHGFAVINTIDNTIEAVVINFGTPVAMSINDQTTRAIICSETLSLLERR